MPNLQATPYPAGTLQGTANIVDMEITAHNLANCPLQRDRDKGLKYVEVTVKNTGQNIAVILGNSIYADYPMENFMLDAEQKFQNFDVHLGVFSNQHDAYVWIREQQLAIAKNAN